MFLDLNSASPGTKQQAAALIDAAGAHYVEAGVMTSVPPYGIKVPMLLGGARAADLARRAHRLGHGCEGRWRPRSAWPRAIKMCRSVMIKGLEALVIESYSHGACLRRGRPCAAHAGRDLSHRSTGTRQGAYFFSRVVQHGQRRAEEMREAPTPCARRASSPSWPAAIADKQQWVADQARAGVFSGVAKGAPWQDYADALLTARAGKTPDA